MRLLRSIGVVPNKRLHSDAPAAAVALVSADARFKPAVTDRDWLQKQTVYSINQSAPSPLFRMPASNDLSLY